MIRGRSIKDSLLYLTALLSLAAAVSVVVMHVSFMRVASASMQPGIAAGDVVLVRAVPAAEVTLGDVVVLPLPEDPLNSYVHRVTDVRLVAGELVVRTKGDANQEPDAWVSRVTSEQVPVVFANLRVAAISNFLTTGNHLQLVVWLLALLALLEIARLYVHWHGGHGGHRGTPRPPALHA